ncbi:MAG: hypothetical protein IPM07_14345 [Anaerolineales bacterium]|nr:hypothetical protein [Anaerolineales bacterium]
MAPFTGDGCNGDGRSRSRCAGQADVATQAGFRLEATVWQRPPCHLDEDIFERRFLGGIVSR